MLKFLKDWYRTEHPFTRILVIVGTIFLTWLIWIMMGPLSYSLHPGFHY